MSDFEHFLSFFPEIEPPVTLTEDSIDHISANNDPLPAILINRFITPLEGEDENEFTEYIPCLKLPPIDKIYPIIYWKASLLRYDFILVTFDDKGQYIERKPLCGTLVENDIIKKSVARIDSDYIIQIVAGAHNTKESDYDASYSQAFNMEIMSNGEIVFTKEH